MKSHAEEWSDGTEYLAFISYRHVDNSEENRQWANWLHAQLEAYEIPEELIGQTNQRGEVIPDRIYPVFQDEASLPADTNLSRAITNALDKSRILVVVCSPGAVNSNYVNNEILHFKNSGKQDFIIAALIEGEPNASIDQTKIENAAQPRTLECFPPALQYHVNEAGALDRSLPTEPIAADFRLPDGSKAPTNSGTYKRELRKSGTIRKQTKKLVFRHEAKVNNALLKIIAGILGVSLEQLTQRDRAFQLAKAQSENRRIRKIAMALALFGLVALVASFIAWQQRTAAEQSADRAIQSAARADAMLLEVQSNLKFMNSELRDVLNSYVPQNRRTPIIRRVDDVVAALSEHGKAGETAQQREIAIALAQKAEIILRNNALEPSSALPLQLEAHAKFEELNRGTHKNDASHRDLAISYIKLGHIQQLMGDITQATKHFELAVSLLSELVAKNPENEKFLWRLGLAHVELARVVIKAGQTARALSQYEVAAKIIENLASKNPDDRTYQAGLALLNTEFGTAFITLGKHQSASEKFESALNINKRLSDSDPLNRQLLRALAGSLNKMGDLSQALGEYNKALDFHNPAHSIRESLARGDQADRLLQADLATSHSALSAFTYRIEDPNEAIEHAKRNIAIRTELTEADPANHEYQSALAMGLRQLALYQTNAGQRIQARKNIKAAHEIHKMLAAEDPENKLHLRDLASSEEDLGGIQQKRGDIGTALTHYESALEIRKSLAANDPKNRKIAAALAKSHSVLGNAWEASSDFDAANYHYQTAINIRKQLVDSKPEDQVAQRFLASVTEDLGFLWQKQHKPLEAIKTFREANQIYLSLATQQSPRSPDRQFSLAGSHVHLSAALSANGDIEESYIQMKKAYMVYKKLHAEGHLEESDRAIMESAETQVQRMELLIQLRSEFPEMKKKNY